jgi:hypothetical protein
MKILKRLTRSIKDAYWDAVQDCLVDLDGVPLPSARSLCSDRRASVEFVPRSLRSNIFYHREPFEVALDLARRHHGGTSWQGPNLDDPQVAAAYDAILARHGLS